MAETPKNDLLQRSITGALFVLVVVGCVVWRFESLILLFAVLAGAASFEYVKLQSKITETPINPFLFCVLALPALMVSVLFLLKYSFVHIHELLFMPMFVTAVVIFWKGGSKTFVNLGMGLAGLIFISLPFAVLPLFTFGHNPQYPYEYRYILALLTLVWTNDTMAYVTGRLIGKNKLAPLISPGKTVEGFFGGIVFAGAAGAWWAYLMDGSYLNWILLGVSVGVAATLGDLAESLLKRTAGVKDSGNIFPGHGGVLDRFDGFLGAVPVMLFFFILHVI